MSDIPAYISYAGRPLRVRLSRPPDAPGVLGPPTRASSVAVPVAVECGVPTGSTGARRSAARDGAPQVAHRVVERVGVRRARLAAPPRAARGAELGHGPQHPVVELHGPAVPLVCEHELVVQPLARLDVIAVVYDARRDERAADPAAGGGEEEESVGELVERERRGVTRHGRASAPREPRDRARRDARRTSSGQVYRQGRG